MIDKQIDALFASDYFKKKLNEYILANLKIKEKPCFLSDGTFLQYSFADKVIEIDDSETYLMDEDE